MRKIPLLKFLLPLACAGSLAACSPKYDWRDYRSADGYATMFPDKPATQTRTIDLDGIAVKMTMTAAQVDGTSFAVGSAELADPGQTPRALEAMRLALVRNIGATVRPGKAASPLSGRDSAKPDAAIDVEAIGAQNGAPMLLVGHFAARGKRIYQVIVVGKEKAVVRDQVDTFMSAFKLN